MNKFSVVKILIFFYLFCLPAKINADEIVFVDLNKIMNESIVGKYINNQIDIEKNKILEKFKSTENKLKKNEDKVLSQKNLLKPEEFNKKVAILKSEVANYNNQRKIVLSEFKEKQSTVTKKIIAKINIILTNYMKDKSISLIIRKKDIIVAKKKLDITDEIVDLLNNEIVEIKF